MQSDTRIVARGDLGGDVSMEDVTLWVRLLAREEVEVEFVANRYLKVST